MKRREMIGIIALILVAALLVGYTVYWFIDGGFAELAEGIRMNSQKNDPVYVIVEGDTMILTTEFDFFRPTLRSVLYRPWRSSITKVIIRDNIKSRGIRLWFRNMTSLESIEGLEKLDVSHVGNLEYMFLNCKNLKHVDGIEQWDTSRVKHMKGMFQGCASMTDPLPCWAE